MTMTSADMSRFDPASLAILDRVNHAIHLLESSSALRRSASRGTSPAPSSVYSNHVTPPVALDARTVRQDPRISVTACLNDGQTYSMSSEKNDDRPSTEALSVNSRCSCTCVLEWPVFQRCVNKNSIGLALIERERHPLHDRLSNHDFFAPDSALNDINEGNIERLVQRFLRNVHTKNPIFDPAKFLNQARNLAKRGLGRDAASCLVLIACALGSLSTTWQMTIPSALETSSDAMRENATAAQLYYTAVRERLGSLEICLESAQCWFLTGVYEMYSMRPIRGWTSFTRACHLIEVHLFLQGLSGTQNPPSTEQRLYWSCLKSEIELREEFDLPSPGLAQLGHRTELPAPPDIESMHSQLNAGSDGAPDALHEQSWFYYLSDIAHRQISYRVQTLLYSKAEESWLNLPLPQLQLIIDELDAQVMQWWTNLPDVLSPPIDADTDELTYIIYLNYADTRERIWRPLLYVAIHGQFQGADGGTVNRGAETCLQLSFEMIENARLKHRHHGCWQTIRCMLTKAFLILAAAKSKRVALRDDWRDYVHSLRSYLQYWQDEAPDLRAASDVLTLLITDVDQHAEC